MSTTPCDNCDSGCCRKYHLVIDGHDAYRIACALKLPLIEFCELRYVAEADTSYRILLNTIPEAEKRFHRLVLRKLPEPQPGKYEERCIFLLTVGDRGRCGIYDVRPGMCSTYPTGLTDGLVGFDAGGQYCPPNGWQMASIDVPAFRGRHHRRQRHKILWDALIDGWNRRLARDAEAVSAGFFFRFVMNAYDDLTRRQPALFDEQSRRAPESTEFLVGQVDETLRTLGWDEEQTPLA